MIDAISTPGIEPPEAFHRLRRDLHDAAGPERIATSRTRDTVSQLRCRADFLRDALALHAGTGLGDWYAQLATRLDRTAREIERDAQFAGIIRGDA